MSVVTRFNINVQKELKIQGFYFSLGNKVLCFPDFLVVLDAFSYEYFLNISMKPDKLIAMLFAESRASFISIGITGFTGVSI